MDIDALLSRIRNRVVDIRHAGLDRSQLAEAAEELAADVADLDSWIVKGGFLPTSWVA